MVTTSSAPLLLAFPVEEARILRSSSSASTGFFKKYKKSDSFGRFLYIKVKNQAKFKILSIAGVLMNLHYLSVSLVFGVVLKSASSS